MSIVVIAYISLHEDTLHQKLYRDCTPLEAMNSYLDTAFEFEEEVYNYCSDSDSFISYLEVEI